VKAASRTSPRARIRTFIEEGKEGTVREIAAACAVGLETAYACLKRMESEGDAARLYQREVSAPGRPKADVWGRPRAPEPDAATTTLSITIAALAARCPLEIAWHEGFDQ
jgi:transposase